MSDLNETTEAAIGASKLTVLQSFDDPAAVEFVEPGDDLVEELSAYDQAMKDEDSDTEGSFLTGGNTRDFIELTTEKDVKEAFMLNPLPVKDGDVLLNYLRKYLHKFDSPYAYIGGEANSPDQSRFAKAEVKILVARLSSYESVSLSMSHSLMSQIYAELPFTFTDLAFMPKPNDYNTLKDNNFPVWFGTNTKLAPNKFDVLSITHAVSMEQLNFVPLLHDSGIPIFKEQRMLREDIPLIIVGGANSGTTAPLSGEYVASDGTRYSNFIDAVIYGDGEEAAKEFIEVVREGKRKGLTKPQILESCHGRVQGFFEPDKYVHEYDGTGLIKEIRAIADKYEFPVKRATVRNLDTVRTLEEKILPYTGDGASVDVAIAGSVGCIGSAGWGACSFCREGSEGPYRERSVDKVMAALDRATRNQGTKEVSFFSLNFNMYTDLFPLVEKSVKKGYKIGLISQRIDMLAETPEQVHVQRWLKKSNFTLGIEGISNRIRAFLNKNVQEWEILKVCREMMLGGAGELKMFYILCLPAGERVWTSEGMVQIQELCSDVVLPPFQGEKVPGLPCEAASVVSNDGLQVWGGELRAATKWVTKSETQIVKVTNHIGQVVRMAFDHLVKTEGGWKKAGELTSDDYLKVAIGGIHGNSNELTLSQARVLGQAVGDGGAHAGNRGFYCAFNYSDPDEINYLRDNGEKSGWFTSKGDQQMYFAEADAKVWAKELTGTAWTKKVPEVIYRSPANVVAAWVEGYFQADGALNAKGYPRWCSRSEQLLRGTQELLLSLGVVSRLHLYQTTNGAQWHLIVRGSYVAKFKELVSGCPKASRIRETAYDTDGRNDYSQVVSVVMDGVEPVYSPVVEHSDQTYYASGLVHHNTNMETEVDVLEHAAFMEKVNALREKLGAKTRFRLSFTPLFPSAFTALQFSPCLAAIKFGEKNLNGVFEKARDLGWGRRLSVSGEEPLISNTINHGGRNITPLLLHSHFADGFRFYGNVPKGTWARWQKRIAMYPNIDIEKMWGEKDFSYIFPWEDIHYSTSKEVMYRGYLKAVTFNGVPYCITTPTIKGECVAEGEPVLTEKGFKPIEEVQIGDLVWTREGLKPVTAKFDQGVRETVIIRTSLGHTLRCTPDHKIYVEGEWVEAGDLEPGQRLNVLRGVAAGESTMDAEDAYLYGYFTGDGNVYVGSNKYGGKVRLCVAHHESELEQKLIAAMAKRHGKAPYRDKFRSHDTLVWNSTTLAREFASMNLKQEVPEDIRLGSPEVKKAYLQGLWDADGNAHERAGYQLTNISETLMRDVQLLLQSMGVESTVRDGHGSLTLRVRGPASEKLFTEVAGFTLAHKKARTAVRKQARGFYEAATVESVEEAGETQLWDITVEDAHHFVAGGFVVHNCHVNECGACDPGKTGKPDQKIIKMIVGRKVAPPMSVKEIERIARSRDKAYHLRVSIRVDEPMYRYVGKGYFASCIARAFMRVSDKFTDVFVGAIGHARIGSGANGMRDWVYGHNIYDFSLCEMLSETELKELIPLANAEFKEGTILDVRMDTHLTSLRNDVDFAVYSMLIPASEYSYKDLRDDVGKYFERKNMGRKNTIKVKKAFGKDIFKTVDVQLDQQEIRQVDVDFRPDLRGCVVRMVVSQRYNVLSMLETITGRKSFRWKGVPVYCDGYIQLSEQTGDVDVFEALSGNVSYCTSCGGSLERNLFTGEKHSDVCLSCSMESYPLDTGVFFTRLLKSADTTTHGIENYDEIDAGSGDVLTEQGVYTRLTA